MPLEGPEFELLLCAARRSLDAPTAARVEAILHQPIRWAFLQDLAERHGLAPLLFTHLSRLQPDLVPATAMERLRLLYGNNARRNLLLAAKLSQLAEHLALDGIPAIALKGPALGLTLYGSLALRVSFDLDLMVHREDLLRVHEVLVSRDFQPEFRGRTPRQETSYLRSGYEYKFNHDADLIHLEIRWTHAPRAASLPVDLSRMWRRPRTVSVGGRQVPVPPPEEELLLLCIHGAKHLWERLLLICDVAESLRANAGLDWRRTLHLADKSGSRRILFLGLFLANRWLGAPLPPEIADRIRADRRIPELAAQVAAGYSKAVTISSTEWCRFQWSARERLRDRMRMLGYAALDLHPIDWQRAHLPDSLFPLYYGLRLVRLAAAYSRLPFSRRLSVRSQDTGGC